jgi:hypothetical protein
MQAKDSLPSAATQPSPARVTTAVAAPAARISCRTSKPSALAYVASVTAWQMAERDTYSLNIRGLS